jgi:hypothetical protein
VCVCVCCVVVGACAYKQVIVASTHKMCMEIMYVHVCVCVCNLLMYVHVCV